MLHDVTEEQFRLCNPIIVGTEYSSFNHQKITFNFFMKTQQVYLYQYYDFLWQTYPTPFYESIASEYTVTTAQGGGGGRAEHVHKWPKYACLPCDSSHLHLRCIANSMPLLKPYKSMKSEQILFSFCLPYQQRILSKIRGPLAQSSLNYYMYTLDTYLCMRVPTYAHTFIQTPILHWCGDLQASPR